MKTGIFGKWDPKRRTRGGLREPGLISEMGPGTRDLEPGKLSP